VKHLMPYFLFLHFVIIGIGKRLEGELTKCKEFMAAKIGMEIIFDTFTEPPNDAISLSVTVHKPYS